jgi:hypothetical protein
MRSRGTVRGHIYPPGDAAGVGQPGCRATPHAEAVPPVPARSPTGARRAASAPLAAAQRTRQDRRRTEDGRPVEVYDEPAIDDPVRRVMDKSYDLRNRLRERDARALGLITTETNDAGSVAKLPPFIDFLISN